MIVIPSAGGTRVVRCAPLFLGRPFRYPYLLPNLIGSGAALLLLPVVIFFIPETKPAKQPRAQAGESRWGETTSILAEAVLVANGDLLGGGWETFRSHACCR